MNNFSSSKYHITAIVHGQVQGVFFRANTKRKAEELGLCGFVRNEPNTTVRIEVEGTKEKIDQLIKWCQSGPERAKVEKVETKEGEWLGFSKFEIRH